MGIFRKAKPEDRAGAGEVQFEDGLLKALLGGGGVTKEMALEVPTVAGGVDLIANVVAGTPIKLYREEGGKTKEEPGDPRVGLLNDETGDTLNAHEFWRAMVRDYYLGKGGYAYIHKEKGRIKSLHYVDEGQIAIQKSDDPIFKDFDIVVRGRAYRPFEFLKILRNTKDGAMGVPITVENAKLIEVAYTSLVFERNIVKRGGNKKGFLKSEKKVEEAGLASLRSAFARLYGVDSEGSDNFVVLNSGIDFKESSNTSVEMQLNENKVANAEEFAKIFHISTAAMSGSVTSGDTANLAKLAAIPLMTAIQCALNEVFLLEKEKGSYYWAFDTKELLKGSLLERYQAYEIAVRNGFKTRNEIRYAEDDPMIPGMDVVTMSLADVIYDVRKGTYFTPNTREITDTQGLIASRTEGKGGDREDAD